MEKMTCCVCGGNCDPKYSMIITQAEITGKEYEWVNYTICSNECAAYFIVTRAPREGETLQ